jgi:hypothetical protein
MLLRKVTVNEIVHAIEELMGPDCTYSITLSSKASPHKPYNGGYYVTINNFPGRVLLYYADSFYSKLEDYCNAVENNLTIESIG